MNNDPKKLAYDGEETLKKAEYGSQEWQAGLHLLTAAYERGYHKAAKLLYEVYRDHGHLDEAWKWLTRWAESTRDSEACIRVGRILEEGLLVRQDFWYAADWFRIAAEQRTK